MKKRVPKGDKYYYLRLDPEQGVIIKVNTEHECYIDDMYASYGNYFQTYAEVKQMREKVISVFAKGVMKKSKTLKITKPYKDED